MTSKIVVNNIESDSGVSSVTFNSNIQVGTGTTIHSAGLDLGTGNITGHNLHSTGIITATSFVGNGANLTNVASTSDINNLINNVAMLGFKVAVNGSLAKYNLVDQVIDEFVDASGIDAAASTNESITGGVVSGSARPTGGTITYYSGYVVHTFLTAGNSNFVVQAGTSGTVDALIVAGGGGGGSYGGGGAGGFRTKASQSVTAQTYTVTVGAGGAAGPNSGTSRFGLDGGDSSVFGVTSTGGGGGGGNSYTSPDNSGRDGGSGGGGGSDHSSVQVAGSGKHHLHLLPKVIMVVMELLLILDMQEVEAVVLVELDQMVLLMMVVLVVQEHKIIIEQDQTNFMLAVAVVQDLIMEVVLTLVEQVALVLEETVEDKPIIVLTQLLLLLILVVVVVLTKLLAILLELQVLLLLDMRIHNFLLL